MHRVEPGMGARCSAQCPGLTQTCREPPPRQQTGGFVLLPWSRAGSHAAVLVFTLFPVFAGAESLTCRGRAQSGCAGAVPGAGGGRGTPKSPTIAPAGWPLSAGIICARQGGGMFAFSRSAGVL